jgi:hypothetical protein
VNILDENIIETQCQLLRKWRIRFRQIGYGMGRTGMQDSQIIALLHGLRQPTFFTRDGGFYDRGLRHTGYCLACLDVRKEEVAFFVRRFLRHAQFSTKTKRMGSIVRVSHAGVSVWRVRADEQMRLQWEKM